METRTAGGMTWPVSHCPLLGRVIPSSADVSAAAKQRQREGEKVGWGEGKSRVTDTPLSEEGRGSLEVLL